MPHHHRGNVYDGDTDRDFVIKTARAQTSACVRRLLAIEK
jgi:hypothetical protein